VLDHHIKGQHQQQQSQGWCGQRPQDSLQLHHTALGGVQQYTEESSAHPPLNPNALRSAQQQQDAVLLARQYLLQQLSEVQGCSLRARQSQQ
jgi:hypothetical protein